MSTSGDVISPWISKGMSMRGIGFVVARGVELARREHTLLETSGDLVSGDGVRQVRRRLDSGTSWTKL